MNSLPVRAEVGTIRKESTSINTPHYSIVELMAVSICFRPQAKHIRLERQTKSTRYHCQRPFWNCDHVSRLWRCKRWWLQMKSFKSSRIADIFLNNFHLDKKKS
ncbi:unnamed protein product [Caretta caretta]